MMEAVTEGPHPGTDAASDQLFAALVDKFRKSRPQAETESIRKAYLFSANQHKDQRRKSGELYLMHPLEVAHVLATQSLWQRKPKAMRIAVAPTVGFSVQVIKGTALASIIGFVELTKAGTMLNNATFRPFLVYGLVGLIYFCLCYPLSWYARKLEGRLNAAR